MIEADKQIDSEGFNNERSVALTYDRLTRSMDNFLWYRDRDLMAQIAIEVPRMCRRGIDIGCGTGVILRFLAERFPSASWTGIDVSSEMIAASQEKCVGLNNVRLIKQDWINIDLRQSAGLDFALLKNVLHLVDDVAGHVKLLNNMIDSRGEVLVVETISPTDESRMFVERIFGAIGLHRVKKHYFLANDLCRFVARGGLNIQRFAYYDQYIDIREWVSAKTSSSDERMHLLDLIDREMERPSLRSAMHYRPPSGSFGGRMLRRQVFVRAHP